MHQKDMTVSSEHGSGGRQWRSVGCKFPSRLIHHCWIISMDEVHRESRMPSKYRELRPLKDTLYTQVQSATQRVLACLNLLNGCFKLQGVGFRLGQILLNFSQLPLLKRRVKKYLHPYCCCIQIKGPAPHTMASQLLEPCCEALLHAQSVGMQLRNDVGISSFVILIAENTS